MNGGLLVPELVVPVHPGLNVTSPQGEPYRTNIAFKRNESRPTRRQKKAFAAVVSRTAVVTPSAYDTEACKFRGWRYSQVCDRCGGSCGSFDCSGLQCHCLDVLGIGIGCQNSFSMFTLCWDHGLIISYDEARATLAHWAGIGANGGRSPLPGNEGHIVEGRGPGNPDLAFLGLDHPDTTMEAMGTRWGCLIGNWLGRGWNVFSKIPGVIYAPQPPAWKVQPDMNPAFPVAAILNDPGRGCWMAAPDGVVIYSGPNNEKILGGMISPADKAAFNFPQRQVASLRLIKRKSGAHGFQIIATDGATYIPQGED